MNYDEIWWIVMNYDEIMMTYDEIMMNYDELCTHQNGIWHDWTG